MLQASLKTFCLLAAFVTNVYSFTGVPLHFHSTSSSQKNALSMLGNALVVQNKGGGHGEIGFHLAKILKTEKGCDSVTILQDGGSPIEKLPFSKYGELESEGVEIIWCDVKSADLGELLGGKNFDYVFDNWSKDEETCKPIADMAKSQGVSNYAYVSSGGMYKYGPTYPIKEDGEVKETGQRAVEKYIESIGLPWTSFRPQYIYGPYTNKRDYIDYYVDRIIRDFTVPIANSGDQLVSLTHAYDVANMLAAVVGNDNAPGQVFNCGTDAFISYKEIAKQVGIALGKDSSKVEVFSYDPEEHDLPKKGSFPFRPQHFFVSPAKAMKLLDWAPKYSFVDDLSWYVNDYKTLGLDQGEIDLKADELISVAYDFGIESYRNAMFDNQL